jgi:hypothetical protein
MVMKNETSIPLPESEQWFEVKCERCSYPFKVLFDPKKVRETFTVVAKCPRKECGETNRFPVAELLKIQTVKF